MQGVIFAVVVLDLALLAIWGVRTVAARIWDVVLQFYCRRIQQLVKLKTQLELKEQQWVSQQIHSSFSLVVLYLYDFSGEQAL